VGTCFTLFVVPMFYTFLARKEIAQPIEEGAPAGGLVPHP
jgi:multidrug efflux pump